MANCHEFAKMCKRKKQCANACPPKGLKTYRKPSNPDTLLNAKITSLRCVSDSDNIEMLGTWSYRDIDVKVDAESQQKCPFDQVGWKMGTSEDSPPKL